MLLKSKTLQSFVGLTLFIFAAGAPDLPLLQHAQACCRGILQTINEVVRETEHRQRLSQYQRRLDAAPQFKVVTWSILTRLLLTSVLLM